MNNTNTTESFRVRPIPAFQDNYLWLIDNGKQAMIVDPGDANPIIEKLIQDKLDLVGILITHHHLDHTAGINELLKRFDIPVYGPDSSNIPQVTQTLIEGDKVDILGYKAKVIAVPGHTLDHIAYFIDSSVSNGSIDKPLLFCGDTLFAGGCGRVFEGSFTQMRHSLSKLKKLPSDTRIYCAHEYTQSNLAFASVVEPENQALITRIDRVNAMRANNIPSVPSNIADELATNPFFRDDQPSVIQMIQKRLDPNGKNPNQTSIHQDEIFGEIRSWKDNF